MLQIPRLNYLWKYVEYWAKIEPNFPSIRFGEDRIITAREFKEKTDQLAKVFLNMGISKGDSIVTILPTTPEFIFTFIAASKIGAITIPMDKEYKKADFKLLIPHSNPKVIVSIDKWQKNKIADNLNELKEILGDTRCVLVGQHELGEDFEDLISKEYLLDRELKAAKENQDSKDTILVVWTGGTTGKPKAVELTHQNIIEMCYIEYLKITEWLQIKGNVKTSRNKHLVNLPVSHVGGTVELLGTGIIGGLEMIVQASWSPWDALKAMKEHNIPFMGGVPTMFKILLSIPDLDTFEPKKYLHLVVLSGEKVSGELLQGIKDRICDEIIIGYGSTEAGAEVTFTELGDNLEKLAQGYVGKPLPGVELKIVDEEEKELPHGEIGEILVNGPLTSKSYYNMPEENKTGFTNTGFCKTGDLGYVDKECGLYITGRIKEIIRVGAFTVLPAEIEELVLPHPKIAIAAALGAPDKIKGEVVWLVVGPEIGVKFEDSDVEEIMMICKENLAKFKVPEKIIVYPLNPNDLPITRIGKVDKVRLKSELLPPID
ncbi:MAG: class I adenylate-forming enzyme family protein [Promethearchaeota archaeon]|jgi:acyl-CoA synthetase (AMP-forming)/AMP-acid ligase II